MATSSSLSLLFFLNLKRVLGSSLIYNFIIVVAPCEGVNQAVSQKIDTFLKEMGKAERKC
jgi:hypothetical protein